MTDSRIPVAILGATGAVGQTFIRLLADHPWFRVAEVAASERSAGKSYREATRWIEGEMPANVAALTITLCEPSTIMSPVVFSALDAAAAGDLEPAFARAGRIVLTNAKNFRMDADVPLMIPEVNASHIGLIPVQRKARAWSGAIIANPNCASSVAAVAMAPLHEKFGIRTVFASTMQAVSGAGYPGVPSLDILGNVIPYIGDEEAKIEREIQKMLGVFINDAIVPAPFVVSAHANRVSVEHGHTICLSLAGLPPTAGFTGKILILASAVNAGFVWLAALLVVGTAISVYVYFKIVRAMYAQTTGAPIRRAVVPASALPWACVALCAVATLVLGFYPIAPSDVLPLVK